jgi:hypothetical protein
MESIAASFPFDNTKVKAALDALDMDLNDDEM